MHDPFVQSGPRLKPLQVAGHVKPIEIGENGLTIGRSEDNDLCLPGEDFPSVSTHHARVELDGDKVRIIDLGSRNGTFINGERVETAQLRGSDIIQLGPIGPRFLVMSKNPLSETLFVDPTKVGMEKEPQLSETTVREIVAHRSRRTQLLAGGFAIAAIGALVLWGLNLSREGREGQARLEQELKDTETANTERLQRAMTRIGELQDEERVRETAWVNAEKDRALKADELRTFVDTLKTSSDTLQQRIDSLEKDDGASAQITKLRSELEATRAQLSDAEQKFSLIDPVSIEQMRLSGVGRVREAVVLLETTIVIEDGQSGQVLHESATGEPNFDDDGSVWSIDSTGSGFTISSEGFILTNAHVVSPPSDHTILSATHDTPLEPKMRIDAVFSGTSRRIEARVIKIAQGGIDLALIKIEPFDGMPHLDDFDLDVDLPEPGTDLFLFGFPLGNFALQEGDTVIASTFRGILSRMVGGNIQVDAGVHPGNSGGPITDVFGRVIGVVYSVQALPGGEAVYTIGYGIPVTEARSLWPPEMEATALVEDRRTPDGAAREATQDED